MQLTFEKQVMLKNFDKETKWRWKVNMTTDLREISHENVKWI